MSSRGIDNSNSVFGWFISQMRISLHNTKNSQISKRISVAKIKDVTLVDLSQHTLLLLCHLFSPLPQKITWRFLRLKTRCDR